MKNFNSSILANLLKPLLLISLIVIFSLASVMTANSGFQNLHSLTNSLVQNTQIPTVSSMDGVHISKSDQLRQFDNDYARCHRWLGYRFAALPDSVMKICQQFHLQSNPSS